LTITLYGRADEEEFSPVKFDFRAPDELIEVKSRDDGADHRQTVGLGHIIKVVGRDLVARAGHVLDDGLRVSGDVLDYVGGNNTRPLIVESAGSRAGDDPDGLSLVERLLLTVARRTE
jgi:hypothetical protein